MDPREFQFTFYGLMIVWLIITVYVLTLALRERRLKQELNRARQQADRLAIPWSDESPCLSFSLRYNRIR
jgi:CcmD family protein